MISFPAHHGLSFPHTTPPRRGELVEIAPGVLWARLDLPFRLDHVNIYLIDDRDGWALVNASRNCSIITRLAAATLRQVVPLCRAPQQRLFR
jgi:hypothetical protein